ncbi:acetaldehyde dehydrogenase (acetylating) [Paenibacillus herberti]|uniref:acetaldehyde dehydrogenase (acetylating) n=1 Tax=Paenibacillus herberti TaxID=1619309 RepID=UPI001C3C2149|nr:acetaldehyde dehydrogenase (acetylating) [Paenibacillus herberti]
MAIEDKDLRSIQEARELLRKAKTAQKALEALSQEKVDAIVGTMAEAGEREAERLARMAADETGFGNAADKETKNLFAVRTIYSAIKDMKTVGIIRKDEANKLWEIAQPFGVICGIVPSTNPTSTTMYKALISIKTRNAIVFSPHPSALACTLEAARIMQSAIERAGGPKDAVACITEPTMEATQELMKSKLSDLILATGGTPMVRSAYSSGKPAYGVGPGNVPAYIHQSAKVKEAVRRIFESKTFDYGTICASEQAIVTDRAVKTQVMEQIRANGGYMLNSEEKSKVASVILAGGRLNPNIVGRSATLIAEMAGIAVPAGTRVLVAEETEIGKAVPFSLEKLCPILALYTCDNWRDGCLTCTKLLENGGLGHSLGIHCEEMDVIEAFGLEKPASRIIVNAGTTFGAIGATSGIFPSLTLGCGSYGHNITSDNVGPMHLINIKRVAFGLREMELDNRIDQAARQVESKLAAEISRDEVKDIIRKVLEEIQAGNS